MGNFVQSQMAIFQENQPHYLQSHNEVTGVSFPSLSRYLSYQQIEHFVQMAIALPQFLCDRS